MASEGLKFELFKSDFNELKQIKMDFEQLKNELNVAQTKYHQRLADYEAKFEQLHRQAEKIQQEQDEKEANLLSATAEWQTMKTKLESSIKSPNERVKLNVGGRYFQTTLATLTNHSEGKLTYFKTFFAGHWQSTKDPKDESIFIDRDGDLFEYILQYLRTDKIPIDLEDNFLRRDLIIEAHFYTLDTLVKLLDSPSTKKERTCRAASSKNLNESYYDTKLLSINNQFELNKLSGFDDQNWQLIYRASRDGYTAKAFHQSCDGCFPTMCVIRSKQGFIFGGFTSIPWSSINQDVCDASAFLFTLKNPYGIKPTKYPISPRAVEYALDHNLTRGPTFGSLRYGGEDLTLRSPFNAGENRISFPHSYQDITYQGHRTFTGESYFSCDDIEMFTLV